MTNRDLVLMKLIQLSPDRFADLLSDQITELMNGALCDICMKRNNGSCPAEESMTDGCKFDLAAWLQETIGNDELVAAAVAV